MAELTNAPPLDAPQAPVLALNPDNPIRNVDEDRLGVYPFVRRLARPLLEAPRGSSLVVGLYGPWGYGKSSALNLLAIALKEVADGQATSANVQVPQPLMVRFTPWLYSSVETLLAAFFETLGTALGDQPGGEAERERRKGALKAMGEFVAPALRLGTMLIPLPGGPVVGKFVEGIADTLQGVARGSAAWLEGGEITFRQRKEEAARVLADLSNQGRPQRVVLLIDDLDRAGPEEVLAMLKLVRLVADLPNISYVVAMDRNRVRDLLATIVAPAYGNDFLDKMVQIGVTLPPFGADRLSRFAVDGAMEIAKRAGMSADALAVDWSPWDILRTSSYEVHLRASLRTPRDVSRLLNAFGFAVLTGDARADMHPVDLLLLCLLQTRFPTVYDAVRSNRRFMLNEEWDWSSFSRENREEKAKAQAERQGRLAQIATEVGVEDGQIQVDTEAADPVAAIRNLRRGQRPPALDILLTLFPHCLNEKPDEQQSREARLEARICSPERFDGYFRLDPVPDQLQLAEIAQVYAILTNADLSDEKIPEVGRWVVALTDAERESLAVGLADLAGSLDREGARAMCMTLPKIASALARPEASLPSTVITHITRRAVVRLRTVVYGEEVDREQGGADRERGLRLLKDVIASMPAIIGADFADDATSDGMRDLELSPDETRDVAALGLEHSLSLLESIPNVFESQPTKEAGEIIWTCRRLAGRAASLNAADPYPPLREYLDRLVRANPLLLSEVLALVAGRSIPDYYPSLQDHSREETLQSLDRLTDCDWIERLAREAVASGDVDRMRWPHLVREFVRWSTPGHDIAGNGALTPQPADADDVVAAGPTHDASTGPRADDAEDPSMPVSSTHNNE